MAYTKKAFNDIFDFCSNDSDFTELYLDYYKTIHPEQDLIARSCKRDIMRNEFRTILKDIITDYLYNGEFLKHKYLDCSYLIIKQYGKERIVSLDDIYLSFGAELTDKKHEYLANRQ